MSDDAMPEKKCPICRGRGALRCEHIRAAICGRRGRATSALSGTSSACGSRDAPTFTPSILVQTGHFVQPEGKHCDRSGDPEWPCDCVCCHSFVTDGRIQFLSDCTHALAGQTVDLPDLTEEPGR